MTKRDNILLVANWESNVGFAWWLMENFWITISRHFATEGKSCFLIFPSITRIPEPIASSAITSSELDFQDRSLSNLVRLYRFIKSHSIKHIYLSDMPAFSLFYLLLRTWGIKTIVVHDHTPGERTKPAFIKRFIKTLIQRLPLCTADHIIAVTDFVLHRLIEVACIPGNKCSAAPNGIKPIDLKHADIDYARNAFNIPPDRKIIVTTGRASYYKGIDFFIECANELVNNQGQKQLHFLFCGDGPDMKDFESLSKSLDLEQHFTFAGKRTDVCDILPSCDIGFHAATGEVGYSLSILEYMSAGLVTIVPDNPSTSLATDNMENGILYTSRNLQSACDAIKQALDPAIASHIRNNAIQVIQEHYCIDNTNKKLIDILQPVFN